MVTLDNIHQSKVIQIKNIDANKCQIELNELIDKRKDILKSTESNATELMLINEKIESLKHNIEGGSDNKFLRDYYLETGEILFKYYDSIENISSSPSKSNLSNTNSNNTDNNIGILSYLNKTSSLSSLKDEDNSETEYSQDEIENDDKDEDCEDQEDDIDETKIDDETFFTGPTSREDLRHQYLDKIESTHSTTKKKKTTIKFKCFQNNCEHCKTELSHIHSEGIVECQNCGVLQTILNDTDKASYKDPPKESCYYSYRRSNHFNEWIAQFQGKETTQIPKSVLVQVVTEIKKERIRNINELSTLKVRAILKKLKLNKYYEHIPHIINQLNGQPPPYMSRSTEELLRIMFQKIQGPFLEFCPKKRKNFLSYSYVLHKFVELLDLPHLKPLFPLLKSREKLHSQDQIWQKICDRVGWTFHKSM